MAIKVGDIVTGTKKMQKYPEYRGYFIVEALDPEAHYSEPTMHVKALTPCEYYERLQFQRHFKLAPK